MSIRAVTGPAPVHPGVGDLIESLFALQRRSAVENGSSHCTRQQ